MNTTRLQQTSVADVAMKLHRFLLRSVEQLEQEIATLGQEIARIDRLPLMNEDEERRQVLAANAEALSDAIVRLNDVEWTGGYGGWKTPIASFKARLAVRRARQACADAQQAFDEPEVQAQRRRRIDAHNNQVATQRSQLGKLRREYASSMQRRDGIVSFHRNAAYALNAALRNGWTARDFPGYFRAMAAQAEAGDVQGASVCLSMLNFQRQPSDDAYVGWEKKAIEIRNQAYLRYGGMSASGAYGEITARSVKLGRQVLREAAAKTLDGYAHPSDQWQALSYQLADPRRFKVDAMWAIYWAMYQCGHWAADALSESDDHEDIFTGKLSAQLDRWLSGWAAVQVPRFGYPNVASYMGTLDIASTSEESRLGADIGLIVDLQLGDFVCRKVVLFQAKKVRDGITDLGSKSQQLPILAAAPQKGFYLFYHRSTPPVRAPAPTICSARELADIVTAQDKRLDAQRLRLNVRTLGWDWASFISFGLCEPASGVGETFSTPADALKALGNGDPRHLPKHLHFIAIADEPRVLALRQEIQKHYLEVVREKNRKTDQSQDRERDIADGRDLDLGM